jgi:hypothetical protein
VELEDCGKANLKALKRPAWTAQYSDQLTVEKRLPHFRLTDGGDFSLPLDLELDFFGVGAAFVFDVELGIGGDVDAFAGDLDFEFFAAFEGVGEAAKFVDELVDRVIFFDVAFWFVAHGSSIEEGFWEGVEFRFSGLNFRLTYCAQEAALRREVLEEDSQTDCLRYMAIDALCTAEVSYAT